jgi:hypothetical protein
MEAVNSSSGVLQLAAGPARFLEPVAFPVILQPGPRAQDLAGDLIQGRPHLREIDDELRPKGFDGFDGGDLGLAGHGGSKNIQHSTFNIQWLKF